MLVEGKDVTFSSSWHLLEIPDSFVVIPNKLVKTKGNGEAKLYIPPRLIPSLILNP